MRDYAVLSIEVHMRNTYFMVLRSDSGRSFWLRLLTLSSKKRSIILQAFLNYSYNIFITMRPRLNVMKTFTAIIYERL
jgi:hypothetical protein